MQNLQVDNDIIAAKFFSTNATSKNLIKFQTKLGSNGLYYYNLDISKYYKTGQNINGKDYKIFNLTSWSEDAFTIINKCTVYISSEGSGIKYIMFYDNWGAYLSNGNQSGWQRDNSIGYMTFMTSTSKNRLAAAVRLRIAVALELVAGKVRALLDTVQTARGYGCRNGTSSPCMGQELRPCAPVPRPTTLAEREELLRRWADSEIRPQGAGSGPPFGRTERQARGLDSVARDNLADSLMPQGSTCWPYPQSTGLGRMCLGA